MKKQLLSRMTATGLLLALAAYLAGCAATVGPATGSASAAAKVVPARITVLYDAFGRVPEMTRDWGYSALVEVGGRRILFDAGNDDAILTRNARAAGVDLAKLDLVVMSHRHGDHMGGLWAVLRANPQVQIYAPKEGFGVYGADLPGTFYRRDEALAPESRYYGGQPPAIMRFGAAFPGARITLVDKSTEILPGLHLIAQVSDAPGTRELKELSLAIDTVDGLVLVVGCSHPGIQNIVAEAARIDPHIHLIAGGMHLVVAPDEAIAKVVTALHDDFRVDYVAPGHCSGEPTFHALRERFGEHDLYAGLGTRITLGAVPQVQAGGAGGPQLAAAGMDAADLRSYRALVTLADGDERPVPALALLTWTP